MDKARAEAIIHTLCGAFDVECPKIKLWNNGSGRAHYDPWRREIFISAVLNSKNQLAWPREMTILHEFAHYLFHARKGFVKDDGKLEWHGGLFTQILIDVSEFWYGEPVGYGWKREYARVRRKARKILFDDYGYPESMLQF